MRALPAASIIVLLVALLTLTMKAQALKRAPDLASGSKTAILRMLRHHGFEIELLRDQKDPISIDARLGACALTIYVMSPQGWHRDLLYEFKRPDQRVYFAYKGIEYADQPLIKTWTDYQLWRVAGIAGLRAQSHAVLGVLTSTPCQARLLPWSEVDGPTSKSDLPSLK